MVDIECIVQEGCVAQPLRPKLGVELIRLSTSILGGSPDDADAVFKEIPKGFGYRGGQPSTTSAIGVRMPERYEPEARPRLLRAIGEMWCEIVGCSTDEFVAWTRERDYQG